MPTRSASRQASAPGPSRPTLPAANPCWPAQPSSSEVPQLFSCEVQAERPSDPPAYPVRFKPLLDGGLLNSTKPRLPE